MIKTCNERIMITLPMNLVFYLKKLAKKNKITLSKLICSLINKNANRTLETIIENQDEEYLLEIAKARWIDD